jgi:hypothetical protein
VDGMKYKIHYKSLDSDAYAGEIKDFEKLGYYYVLPLHKEYPHLKFSLIDTEFKMVKSIDDDKDIIEQIEFWKDGSVIKYEVQDGNYKVIPYTKEELKILDIYDWEINSHGDKFGQDVTDWIWM